MSAKTIDITKIMKLLPHRYPFLLVDKVVDYKEREWIKAVKNVTINESFFQGHFPGHPIMPGVLIIEALAQAGGILALVSEKGKEVLAYFMTIDNAKFRKVVVPGDQLVLHAEVTKLVRANIVQIHGKASVQDKVVCEADLMFSIIDKNKVKQP
ncbi:MAG: 3-hydroxyacyl-ACP dehydratase FabZ [Candidatus Omnitrophota bacterium]